jgi:hypothetical protein
MRELVESEFYISQKALSRRLDLHHDTIHRILLEEFGLCKINSKRILYFLREFHKQESIKISMNLLRFLDESSPQKLVSVSIGDEK